MSSRTFGEYGEAVLSGMNRPSGLARVNSILPGPTSSNSVARPCSMVTTSRSHDDTSVQFTPSNFSQTEMPVNSATGQAPPNP
jgi:hypothetical protein